MTEKQSFEGYRMMKTMIWSYEACCVPDSVPDWKKNMEKNQTGTEPGTLIENSIFKHLIAVCDTPRSLNQNMSISFSHNSKFYC